MLQAFRPVTPLGRTESPNDRADYSKRNVEPKTLTLSINYLAPIQRSNRV
jgi:hypothetical protein